MVMMIRYILVYLKYEVDPLRNKEVTVKIVFFKENSEFKGR
jgi:hypothetical protein